MIILPRVRTVGFLSGIAIIPLILCAVFLLTQSLKAQYRNAEILAYRQTERIAQELNAVLLERVFTLDHIGSSYFESTSDKRMRERDIDRLISSRDDVNDIIIVDSKGKELIHRSRDSSGDNTLTDRSENIEFISIKEKGYYFGPLYVSQERSVFLIGRAIAGFDNEQMRGAIFALLNGSILQDVLKEAGNAQGGSVFVVNDKGTIVAHPTTSYIVEGKDFSHNFALRLAMSGESLLTKTYHNEFDQKVIGSGVPLSFSLSSRGDITPRWYVITETPLVSAYGSALHQRSIAFITIIIFLALAGAGVFFVWRHIMAPIKVFQYGAEQLNQGNLAYRMHATSHDIWGNVAVAFNAIADKMKRISGERDEERYATAVERSKLKHALMGVTDAVHARFLEKVKNDFVAIAAHQLLTPLSEVKWSMEILMKEDLGALSRKQKSFLKRSYQSNEHMIRLVDDLLETAKIEEQQLSYNKEPYDLKKLIEEGLAIEKKKAEKKGLTIVVKKSRGKIPLISIDNMAIKVVFKNLLENAIHYTPAGGTITVSLAKKDAGVGMSITDTGIGVLPEDHAYLFTKFFRGKNAVKMKTDGTGLGLYISKKIIDAHGGSMWVNSEFDRGSTFGFDIPLES